MDASETKNFRRILNASANPLFGQGLLKLIRGRWGSQRTQVRLIDSNAQLIDCMQSWQPDLVIVDYDDKTISRAEFLQKFIGDDFPVQVMLVSLQASGQVTVYDRRTLTPAQMSDWLNIPGFEQPAEKPPVSRRNSSMKHFAIVIVLVILSTVLVYLGLTNVGLLPVEASDQAQTIDQLFNLHFLVIAFLFSLIVVFMAYSLIVFRKKEGDNAEGKFIKGNNRLEVIWTIIPLGIVIYFSYLGSVSLAETQRVDPQAMEVKVVGGQWFWRFEYPEYGITSDKLVLPVDEQVLLRMTSLDVIHSFWVPEFRVKQDLLPGENFERELRVTPSLIGEYKVRCAEMCGTSHAYMEAPVLVVSQADFDTWVKDQLNLLGSDPAARGEIWAKNNGCLSCHSVDGSVSVGPTWQGLFGETVTLADGSTATVDDAYLHTAIVEPNAQVAQGFPAGVMPQSYAASLSEQQISEIIDYIRSLE